MNMNSEYIEKIQDVFSFLYGWSEWHEDYKDEFEEQLARLKKNNNDVKSINMYFPDDFECMEIDVKEFLVLCDEIKSIDIVSNSYIRTLNRSYYIVEANDTTEDYLVREYLDFKLDSTNGIEIRMIEESAIVGLAAVKLEEYDKEYWGTYGQYLVIEIIYDDNSKRLTDVIEKELVFTYLYEIADNFNISLSFSEIRNPNYDYFDRIEEAEENPIQELRELVPYNEGMRLYLSANQIKDQELKFLNFYKVLEHFSPIAINIEAYELMRKKLDVPKRQIINGDYIKSIFDLANMMKAKFNDEELLKSSFNNCFDFVGLFDKLPEIIKNKVRKQCKVSELTYKTDKDKIEIARNMVGAIVYKTRNKVVHAKSNYKKTREELGIEDIEILNDFMREATSQAIRWYSRLPEHLKLELIK